MKIKLYDRVGLNEEKLQILDNEITKRRYQFDRAEMSLLF